MEGTFSIGLPFRPGLAPVLGRRDKKDLALLNLIYVYFGQVGNITESKDSALY